jgi:predicted peroxiredoxin
MDDGSKFLLVLEHHNSQFDELPFSTARSWVEDSGVDVAMWLLYDSIHIVRREEIEKTPVIKELVDFLLQKGVPIYVCGFCTRACELTANNYYPGIVVGNRKIYFSLVSQRKVLYY